MYTHFQSFIYEVKTAGLGRKPKAVIKTTPELLVAVLRITVDVGCLLALYFYCTYSIVVCSSQFCQ